MPSGIAIAAAIRIDSVVRSTVRKKSKPSRAAGHALPQRLEGRGGRRQQHRVDDLHPHRDVPEHDQADDADDWQIRLGIEALHPLRTSRWNTSRQCAFTRTNSVSDRVASVRSRAAS